MILSFGGSLGADRINQVVADLCAWEKQTHRNVLHLHATGSRGVKLFEGLEKEKNFAPGENLVRDGVYQQHAPAAGPRQISSLPAPAH